MQFVEHDALQRCRTDTARRRTASSSASCSGVVSRMSGGSRRWRWRLRHRRVAGAGLDPDRQPHLGDRRLEIARDVDRQRLQRRDVERVQAAACAGCCGRWRRVLAAPSRRVSLNSTSVGRKPASVLPAPVGAISSAERSVARLRQQLQLMRARRPAARGEPAREDVRQADRWRARRWRSSEPSRATQLTAATMAKTRRAPRSPAARAPEHPLPCASRPARACGSSARPLPALSAHGLAMGVAQLRPEDHAAVAMGFDREGEQPSGASTSCDRAPRSASRSAQ